MDLQAQTVNQSILVQAARLSNARTAPRAIKPLRQATAAHVWAAIMAHIARTHW